MSKRTLQLLNVTVPFLVVALSAFGVHLLSREPVPGTAAAAAAVVPGKDYYVFVRLVEAAPQDAQGRAWDSANESAPDLRVEIFWRGQRIYRSSVQQDSLIAKWANSELDVAQIALSGGTASLESVLQAARISIVPGEDLQISVFDQDLPVGDGELAGTLTLPTAALTLGEQTFRDPSPGLKRIVLFTSDLNSPPDV